MFMKSILQTEKESFISKSTANLHQHHIFNGPLRKWSDKEGLWIWLTWKEHEEIHRSPKKMRELKQIGQRKYEETHTHEEFMKHVRKNYL